MRIYRIMLVKISVQTIKTRFWYKIIKCISSSPIFISGKENVFHKIVLQPNNFHSIQKASTVKPHSKSRCERLPHSLGCQVAVTHLSEIIDLAVISSLIGQLGYQEYQAQLIPHAPVYMRCCNFNEFLPYLHT